jgi:hypothetical protein
MIWVTEIKAIDPITEELKVYGGPHVPGLNHTMAEQYCHDNGLGYCKVLGRLISEIPCKKGTYQPDWKNSVDYENNN